MRSGPGKRIEDTHKDAQADMVVLGVLLSLWLVLGLRDSGKLALLLEKDILITVRLAPFGQSIWLLV